MLLTIDAGNTRTKWAIFNRNGEITHTGTCANDSLNDIETRLKSLDFERVMISNVAGKTHAKGLENLLSPYALPITWIKSSRQACNVINNYLVAETLGTDRWAALIAAWHIQKAPCIVVNAGSAVTIDGLTTHHDNYQQGEFIGGMILPGLSMMQMSLGEKTAQLPKPDATNSPDPGTGCDVFALSTTQAIHSGILHAITGAVAQMSIALEAKYGQNPYIILSGGDAPVIQSCLINVVTNQNTIIDHLVLKGLFLIDHFEQ